MARHERSRRAELATTVAIQNQGSFRLTSLFIEQYTVKSCDEIFVTHSWDLPDAK